MKVLLVTQDFYPLRGGIQTYCLELALALGRMGVEVVILCPGKKSTLDEKIPLQIHRRAIFHTSFFFLRLSFFLPRFIRREKITHLLLAQWQNGFWFPFSGLRPRIPVACMVHGRELSHSVFGKWTQWMAKSIFNKFDLAVCNSRAMDKLFCEKIPLSLKSCVIHPGVDPKRFAPVHSLILKKELKLEGKRLLVTLTRLVERKNIAMVVEAVALVRKKIPDVHYLICGQGPELVKLVELRRSLELEESITFAGEIGEDQKSAYYNLAEIFLLPSGGVKGDVEGFGIVYLEAAACSVPAIAANTGGVSDAVEDGVTGVLLKEISVEKIAHAIEDLLSNEQKRIEMGKRARERVLKEFTWDACAKKYLERVFCADLPVQGD